MRFIACLFLLLVFCACAREPETLFTPVTGIDFVNAIPENDSINIIIYEYLYNGGGVGVGDFDRDGNPDLVFSGNMVSSRVYLQKDAWSFTDVTVAAGLETDVWCSGVNVADVDGNGYEDIYFSTLNPDGTNDVPNRLYLNKGVNEAGVPVFEEAAAQYGLDDLGYGTHAAWFDYELDGDLDLYVLNNSIEEYQRNITKGTDATSEAKSVDRIYRNKLYDRSEPQGLRGQHFPEWEAETVKTEGWGLGVAVQDFNQDDYPDLYVGNDFLSDDFLLINQDGKNFRDEIRQRLPHTSRNSMGVDVADLTNDGAPEIMVVDMLPDDNLRQKTMFADQPHQRDRAERQRGYVQQYTRNTLQLNNGDGTFSDIAYLAGVAATDWSWTPLLADFDNDGMRDIFVSNGYPKDITNKDFIDFSAMATQFGTAEAQLRKVMDALQQVDGVHQPNDFFRNEGNLSFSEPAWLPVTPTYSNGAVFVDLDRDGDLDLVTNNINEPAGVLRNNLRERQPEVSHYLQLKLNYRPGNPDGLGTKIWLKYADTTLYHEHYRQRGYLSTVDQLIHFGLGRRTVVDELIIRFPDGKGTVLRGVSADQVLDVAWREDFSTVSASRLSQGFHYASPARMRPDEERNSGLTPLKSRLQAVALKNGPVHQASLVSEFDVNALALRDKNRTGPVLMALDLDGDEVDELLFEGVVWKQADGQLQVTTDTISTQRKDKTTLQQDFTGDGQTDRLQAVDYQHLRLYGSDNQYTEIPNTAGWYYSLHAIDLDGDGDQDVVAGNVGLNTPYRVSPSQPLVVREDDYDQNGRLDPITLAYNDDQLYPVHPRNTLTRQLPGWKRMLTSFDAYGNWTAADLPPMSEAGVEKQAVEFRSLFLENDGAGNFSVRPLPVLAQLAPLQDAVEITLEDGRPALLCVQNDYAVEPLGGRLDAGTGFVLTLNKAGELEVLDDYVSVRGDARSIIRLRSGEGQEMLVVGINNGPLMVLRPSTN